MRLPHMDPTLERTRRSLHGIAETVLAGPEHRTVGRIRLAVTADGFSTLPLPGTPSRIAVRGAELVVEDGAVQRSVPLAGTYADLARLAGVEAGAPEGVYHGGSGVKVDEPIEVDPPAAATILRGFTVGDRALRRLAAAHTPPGAEVPEPVLWPEHFDVGVTLDEVNYGVSAGDSGIPEPYAYVGPWKSRAGDFWDKTFGAARTIGEVGDADAVLAFFETGMDRAANDPLA